MLPYCVLAIENEDDKAFMEGLVCEYERLIYSTILKITDDTWAIDDIYQQTWEKLIDKIPLLRSREKPQRINYMISTAKNLARNYIRDNSRPKETEFDSSLDMQMNNQEDGEFELRLIKAEEIDCLARIWPNLDQRSRQILEGYYILEKSMSELADEFRIKPSSVRMALTRARKNALYLLNAELNQCRN